MLDLLLRYWITFPYDAISKEHNRTFEKFFKGSIYANARALMLLVLYESTYSKFFVEM